MSAGSDYVLLHVLQVFEKAIFTCVDVCARTSPTSHLAFGKYDPLHGSVWNSSENAAGSALKYSHIYRLYLLRDDDSIF